MHEGEVVTIKFDTLPYVQYGMAQGSVRTVSADSFVGHEETQRRAIYSQSQQTPAFYKARIAIDKLMMHDVPDGFQLKPGMPVNSPTSRSADATSPGLPVRAVSAADRPSKRMREP